MFDALFNAIAWLLAWFYDLPGVGYGGAIALLTLAIMVLVTPLNVKATRSMMTMSAMAPEMKRIQQEFAGDRQRMNEELLAFYRENKINPLGGCLPMLVQMPFLIVLYWVINGLTQRASELTEAANGVMVNQGEFLPKYLDQFPGSNLYADLVGSTTMDSFGIDLSRSAATALQVSFAEGLPYMAMILFVAGSAFLQQKQMSMRNPNAEMPPQQKILLRVMPIFFAFISFNFAAGVVVYFLLSNLYRILQNAVISMRLYDLDLLPALLGVGEATISTRQGTSGDDEPPPASGSAKNRGNGGSGQDTGGSGSAKNRANGGSGRTKGGSGSAKNRANGGSGRTKDGSGAGKDSARGNGSKGRRDQPPSRPPSGRVTPKAAGGTQPPRRRKKKRT